MSTLADKSGTQLGPALNVHIIIGERLLLFSSDSLGSDCAHVKALRYFYLLKLPLTLLPECSPPVQHRFNPHFSCSGPSGHPWLRIFSRFTAVSEWFYVPLLDIFFWLIFFFFQMSVSDRGKGRHCFQVGSVFSSV